MSPFLFPSRSPNFALTSPLPLPRSVIIISTVRCDKEYLEVDKRFSLGFLSIPKRFNVAITRAQAVSSSSATPRFSLSIN